MLELIYDFEVIRVKSEAEALLLEGQLIKKYRPRYNTDFTDDKRFFLFGLIFEKLYLALGSHVIASTLTRAIMDLLLIPDTFAKHSRH